MTPTLLILPAPPIPGRTYRLKPIIGDTRSRTAVCQGDGRFVDVETGEVFEREIEIKGDGIK